MSRSCSICAQVGHNIRTCNSIIVQHISDEFQNVSSMVQLENFFKKHTSEKLSIIMLAYGATYVSVNRSNKEEYIRERWREEEQLRRLAQQQQQQPQPSRPQPPVVEEPEEPEEPVRDTFIQLYMTPGGVVSGQELKILADQLSAFVCSVFNLDHIRTTTIFDASAKVMFTVLSEMIFENTRHTHVNAGLMVAKRIFKKLKIPRNDPLQLNLLLQRTIIFMFQRVEERLRQQQQQQFIPHIPAFQNIQICYSSSSKTDDYTCGICAEEYTKKTIPTLNCAHTLCLDCIKGQIAARKKSFITCPYCREEVSQISVGDVAIQNKLKFMVSKEVKKK